jgi:predicted membrane-bound spermidine synthase
MKNRLSAASAFVALALLVPSSVLAATGQKPTGPYVWQTFLITGLIYVAVSLAIRKNYKSVVAFRKLWNVVLLVSFLIAGGTGLATALFGQFGWMWLLRLGDYNTHVTFGLVMTAAALFHILWHWRYFLSLIKRPAAKPASKSS